MTEEVTTKTSGSVEEVDRKAPGIEIKNTGENEATVVVSGDLGRLNKAFGSQAMTMAVVHQMAGLGSHGKALDEDATNFVLGFVDAMAPEDPAEALLITQMATTHQAIMMMSGRLNRVQTVPQQDSAERALTKLSRTFTTQMEALRKYRNGGNQTVTVQHVNVGDGGQAIVGNVKTGGRGYGEK